METTITQDLVEKNWENEIETMEVERKWKLLDS